MRWKEIVAGILVVAGLVGLPAAALAYQSHRDTRVVTIEMVQWEYRPSEIRVKKGEQVRLQLIAKDVVHGFQLDGITTLEVRPGKPQEVIIWAQDPGVYRFRCSMFCGLGHAAMVGQIVVEE